MINTTRDAITSLQKIIEKIETLTDSQLEWVSSVVEQFALKHSFRRSDRSDIVTQAVMDNIGDALRIHHAFSRQALSKDRFEYALEKALLRSGFSAKLADSRTNRGHDITINGVPVSLKTEASQKISEEKLHISKFMELGKGEWVLPKLRDMFLEHMKSYERIFQFRCLINDEEYHKYELVEIPKSLLLEGKNAELVICDKSKQTPKPGYGYVYDEKKQIKYALYFDGGTERKLQIKEIKKKFCLLHAVWEFKSSPL